MKIDFPYGKMKFRDKKKFLKKKKQKKNHWVGVSSRRQFSVGIFPRTGNKKVVFIYVYLSYKNVKGVLLEKSFEILFYT